MEEGEVPFLTYHIFYKGALADYEVCRVSAWSACAGGVCYRKVHATQRRTAVATCLCRHFGDIKYQLATHLEILTLISIFGKRL